MGLEGNTSRLLSVLGLSQNQHLPCDCRIVSGNPEVCWPTTHAPHIPACKHSTSMTQHLITAAGEQGHVLLQAQRKFDTAFDHSCWGARASAFASSMLWLAVAIDPLQPADALFALRAAVALCALWPAVAIMGNISLLWPAPA
eukprot:scaffold114565_cov15-Tisochrysis_lutea.AAC.2